MVVINHRKNTAACVSLSKSTISKTYTRETQGHCLAPVCGGGGDVVASEVLVKNFFSRSPLRRTDPEIGGGGVLATPHFRVKLFFLKNFFRRKRPRRDRRERLPKDNQTPCQPGFSATPQTQKPKLQVRRKSPRKARKPPRSLPRAIWSKRGNYASRMTEARSFSTSHPVPAPRKPRPPRPRRPARLRARPGFRRPPADSASGFFRARIKPGDDSCSANAGHPGRQPAPPPLLFFSRRRCPGRPGP